MRKGERSKGLFTFWFVCETVIHSMCYGYFLSILGDIEQAYYYYNSAYFCAIGFSHLESEFHDFLVDAQSFVRQDLLSYLPVDILEVEPFVPGIPVLDFMTDRQLIALYREEPHIEWDIFYDALDEILDEII